MPCIKIIDSIKVYIYADDHNPPHIHVFYSEHEELIVIRTLDTYTGEIPVSQRKKLVRWASQNTEFLMKEWNKFNK